MDYQRLFDGANENGAQVRLIDTDGAKFNLGLGVRFDVIRVKAPAFWLMWSAAWYTEGQQYTHTGKIVRYERRNDALFLHDAEGRTLIVSPVEPEWEAEWALWTEWRERNHDALAATDQRVLSEHARIAYGDE